MSKKSIIYLCVFVLAFIFSFILFYVYQGIYCDEVWVYGFSYNISNGMIIYRDFNVLQMPLYFFLASLFIKIFGNYIIVMHLFDSLLFSTIIVMLFKNLRWKVLLLLPILVFWWPSGYNLLCLFFLIVIIYLINQNKDNDYLISFLVGLCFITKQNIGLFLFVPCWFYSKKKLKSIITFIIPFLLLSIYLVYNNAFYQFFDYCFLGMVEFGEKNLNYDYCFLILFVVVVLVLGILLIKSKFKNKELFYILMFQLIVYPIFDIRHFICAFFPVMYIILKRINSKYILSLLAVFLYLLSGGLFISFNHHINVDKDLMYLRNSGELSLLAKNVIDYVDEESNFFFDSYYGYLIKLYGDITISQYDLLLSGNVGYKGMDKKLNELDKLCATEKCYFFCEDISDYFETDIVGSQYYAFHNYIISNYEKKDRLFQFDIYSN